MKKAKNLIISIVLASMAVSMTAQAAEVPRESPLLRAPQEAVVITENLVGSVLDEVKNGLGYADAKNKTNSIIFNAVNAGQTNGYGYGILTAIANNAIFEYRDVYMRPDYYANAEAQVKMLIADIITAVENGKDYDQARREAYTRIYQSVNPSYNPDEYFMVDFCYWDMPAVDSAMFNRARKLLLEATARRNFT